MITQAVAFLGNPSKLAKHGFGGLGVLVAVEGEKDAEFGFSQAVNLPREGMVVFLHKATGIKKKWGFVDLCWNLGCYSFS
jgi:hypothetical protein